jgi:hypothetical protein
MNYETENFYDQEIEFTYEGREYYWAGDYSIEYTNEEGDEITPDYGEAEVSIDYTTSLSYYDEDLEKVVEVKPTPSILMELSLEIERTL